MRIAVTGKSGQLVQSMVERAKHIGVEILQLGRPELDLEIPSSIGPALSAAKPHVILSAAAYTAVDKAETERQKAFVVNAEAPGALADVAASLDIPIIHMSTDYVFSGDRHDPYVETDEPNPLSTYGSSKLEGERLVAEGTKNHVILRTSWVYSPFGANFVKTMLRASETSSKLRVVSDQYGRPTSALDVADAVLEIAHRLTIDKDPNLRGVFHLSAAGEASWAEFAEEIFRRLSKETGKVVEVERINTKDYHTLAKRPTNSRLDTRKLRKIYGITLPDWRESTATVLARLLNEEKK